MHVGFSSPTRDQTQAPCIGSSESYPLDHQGSPLICMISDKSALILIFVPLYIMYLFLSDCLKVFSMTFDFLSEFECDVSRGGVCVCVCVCVLTHTCMCILLGIF